MTIKKMINKKYIIISKLKQYLKRYKWEYMNRFFYKINLMR